MDLHPTGRGSDILSMVLGTPTLHETHSNGAHLGELVDRFKAMRYGAREKLGELLVREDLQRASWRNLANCCQMEVVSIVAVA